jgi:hypothetical protein
MSCRGIFVRHVLQPIAVSWARSFESFVRGWLWVTKQPDRREDQFRALGLPFERGSQAQQRGAGLVIWVIDTAHQATTMGLAMLAFRVCVLFPHDSAPVVRDGYIRAGEEEPEKEEGLAHPRGLSTGSQVLAHIRRVDGHSAMSYTSGGCGHQHRWRLPMEGENVKDAEPEISARHAMIEDGADEPML